MTASVAKNDEKVVVEEAEVIDENVVRKMEATDIKA